jgi:hypothetical protein
MIKKPEKQAAPVNQTVSMDHHMQDEKSKDVQASITTIKKGEELRTI